MLQSSSLPHERTDELGRIKTLITIVADDVKHALRTGRLLGSQAFDFSDAQLSDSNGQPPCTSDSIRLVIATLNIINLHLKIILQMSCRVC